MNGIGRKSKTLGKENKLNTCVIFPNNKLSTKEQIFKKRVKPRSISK